MSAPRAEIEEARGQHRAVGNALIGLGGVGAALALLALARHATLRFIDAPTMLMFGLAMAGLGFWQRRTYP